MRREGTDPNNVRIEDVLCDFCRQSWALEIPVIEGHQGSIICGTCMSVAWRCMTDAEGVGDEGSTFSCTMCLEMREDARWESPLSGARICARCVKLAATALEKDKESGWKRPE